MAISLKPDHLKRYKDVALLLWKYGRSDLVTRAGLGEYLDAAPPSAKPTAPAAAEELARDVEKLGPTFIKLGQLLSTRPDVIPPAYADALARLQNECVPFPFAQAEEIISGELGVRLSKAFSHIDPVPLAAASIAQVHRAALRDGREVAVKVQRPNIGEQVTQDLAALAEIARFVDEHTEVGARFGASVLFDEFRQSLLRELDFKQEASNLLTLTRNLESFSEILVPQPIMDYTTSRVLTMDLIRGTKITALSPLARLDIEGERLADVLFQAYLKQMLADGFFHADPHPGNVFLAGDKLALIDLGMVARVPPQLQDRLLQFLLAVSDNRPDDAARVMLLLGAKREDANEAAFTRSIAQIVARHQDATLKRMQMGRAVMELMKAAGESAIRMPPEIAMVGKALLNLDQIAHTLAPHFDPNAAIRRHAGELMERRGMRALSLGTLFDSAIELKNFVQKVPGRVDRILDHLAENKFSMRVETIDETRLMEGLQKVANRITLGLVLAALIVGAALLMSVPTGFELLGYPGLAIVLFLAAAAGGLALVVTIVASDVKARRKR